jgi:metal-sulfur cluster biosynthetic enzyme
VGGAHTGVSAVRAVLNGIFDPCSMAMAEPIGIADMGLVEDIRVEGSHVVVVLVPTSPHCMFLSLFEEEVERRVSELPGVDSVRVELEEGTVIWDETRMTDAARERLARRRVASRSLPMVAGE